MGMYVHQGIRRWFNFLAKAKFGQNNVLVTNSRVPQEQLLTTFEDVDGRRAAY